MDFVLSKRIVIFFDNLSKILRHQYKYYQRNQNYQLQQHHTHTNYQSVKQ